DSGKRGDRQNLLSDLLQFLTGADSAVIVNNNAAAVLLALNTFAYKKETLVSRSQLIEIGGSFRLPEVMRKSGTRLVEVGTTNRTYLHDYEEAINTKTGAILVAHSSNYRVQGFVHEVELGALAALCRQHNLVLIHDLGGGVLLDLEQWDLPKEPVVQESVAAGANVVTFSGDKVLGGPQAGIMVGDQTSLQKICKNHMLRALRPDKITLALLEETLKLYLQPQKLLQGHPVLERLAETREMATSRAVSILSYITSHEAVRLLIETRGVELTVAATKAQLGSGALPLETFPSAALKLRIKGIAASRIAQELRVSPVPVIGYVNKESVYLDVKAVMDDDTSILCSMVQDLIVKFTG
ncbi:MAG: L-seryl-tRNA(Sec) selenium transferase, partial [bacterium]